MKVISTATTIEDKPEQERETLWFAILHNWPDRLDSGLWFLVGS